MLLKGKKALITGAASGLGKAIAELFAKHGADVGVADLNGELATAVAKEIHDQTGQNALGIKMDVSSESEVEAGMQSCIDHLDGIDILVSNAGIQIISPLIDFSYENWQKMMNIHVGGAFLTARAAMRQMIKQKSGGSIIMMGSIHSFLASSDKAAYVTAKHALLGLTRAIAKEGAPHDIRANLVAPGFVKTPLVEKQIPEQAKSLGISEEEVVKRVMLGNTVDGEFTTIDDIAELSLFFAAFPSKALTGQSLLATHGWHMS